jgi:ATP-dependent DNA helicase RecQ
MVKQLLAETASYAESTNCRRRHLLHYFGEVYDQENCGCCDVCLHPKPKMNATEQVQLVIDVIKEVKQQFVDIHIIDIIIGEKTTTIVKFKHNKLKQFGEGEEFDNKFWASVIRVAIFEELIYKDIENYGLLKITPKGMKFLTNPYTLYVQKPKSKSGEDDMDDDDMPDDMMPGKIETTDATLFAMLKDLRKSISQKENLPPFIIFQDPSLEDMCIQYPTSLEEMVNITGVGVGKAQKYGKPFADLIKQYVEDNEIERPQDFIVKSIVKKSAIKVFIIQSIDRKIYFQDIAHAKGLDMDELLTEIESIVASGTKLDIDYYIDDMIEKYHQEDILDYFSEAESDSVQVALDILGEDDFTLEEIRIMRIKYMSDVGN